MAKKELMRRYLKSLTAENLTPSTSDTADNRDLVSTSSGDNSPSSEEVLQAGSSPARKWYEGSDSCKSPQSAEEERLIGHSSHMDLSNRRPQPCTVCGDNFLLAMCKDCQEFFHQSVQEVVLNDEEQVTSGQQMDDCSQRGDEELTAEDVALIAGIKAAFKGKNLLLKPGMCVTPGGGNADLVNLPNLEKVVEKIVTPITNEITDFAKEVPGFIELPIDDQRMLLRSCYVPIFFLRVACLYDVETESLTLYNGHTVNRGTLDADAINLGPLLEPIYEFAVNLHELRLDFTETALLVAMLLMDSECKETIDNNVFVEYLRERISTAFSRYVDQTTSPNEPNRLTEILENMAELHEMSKFFDNYIHKLELDGSGQLPQIFLQMCSVPPKEI